MKELDEILSLVDRFGRMAARVGVSNSGLCIDPSGPSDQKYLLEMREELKEDIRDLWENKC